MMEGRVPRYVEYLDALFQKQLFANSSYTDNLTT
jgi:hypothetical protein